MQDLTSLATFKMTQKIFPEKKPEENMLLCASLTLMCLVAMSDKKVSPEEVSYMKKYSRSLFATDKVRMTTLVTYHLMALSQDKSLPSWQTTLEAHVKAHSTLDFRLKLLQSIFAISRSDLNITSLEKDSIRGLCFRLGIDSKIYAQELVDASTILMMSKKEAMKEFPTSQKDCDELQLVSMSDFAQEILAS